MSVKNACCVLHPDHEYWWFVVGNAVPKTGPPVLAGPAGFSAV